MTLEAFILDHAATFVQETAHDESLIPREVVSVLPLIPHHYLGLRGELYNPTVDMQGVSQETVLKGAWAAMLLPENRDAVLHGMLQARDHYSDADYDRHVELLLPFIDEAMITRCMKKDFEPDTAKTAQHIGGILKNMFHVQNEIMPLERKIQLCTAWVRSLKLEHYTENSRSVIFQLETMLGKVTGGPTKEVRAIAQASLSAISRLTVNDKKLEFSRYDIAVSCVEKALQLGATSSKSSNSDKLFDRLIQRQKGSEQADHMAIILSRWALSQDRAAQEANTMLRKIFNREESKSRNVLEQKNIADAIDTLKTISGFTVTDTTLKQIIQWARDTYPSEKDGSRDVVSKPLSRLLHDTPYEQYKTVYARLGNEDTSEFRLDLLMIMANPDWMRETKATHPVWYELLEHHAGNSNLLRAIVDAAIVPLDECMRVIIEKGHEQWIINAGLQDKHFEALLLPIVEKRVEELIDVATKDTETPSDLSIPPSVTQLLSFSHSSAQAMERVKPKITAWFATLLSRDDVPYQQRETLDFHYVSQYAFSEEHMRHALLHRGRAPMRVMRKRYIEKLVDRHATAELFDAYAQELFGDGIDARLSMLQGVFSLPPANRGGEYIPKIQDLLVSWFRLLRLQEVSESDLPNVLQREGVSVLRQIQSNTFWSDEILRNEAILAVVSKELLEKVLAISQKN